MADETTLASAEPVDPDTGDGRAPGPAGENRVIAVIAAGGVLGTVARYEAGLTWPTGAGQFPWTTLGINVVGCALIGVLMVVVTDVFTGRRLVRPFLGTGVLGGFTTFSAYAVDSQRLIATGHPGPACANLAGTVVAAMLAVTAAKRVTRLAVVAARR